MNVKKFVREAVAEIRATVGDARAISALSGGVDSSVVTVLGHSAIGSRMKVIFIDDGLMRQDEPREVKEAFGEMGIKVRVINARKRFFAALAGLTDPEDKRKAFRHTFYQVLGEAVTWVATPAWRAASTTARDSRIVRVSGLTQQTCFFFRSAGRTITACVWSGVPQ